MVWPSILLLRMFQSLMLLAMILLPAGNDAVIDNTVLYLHVAVDNVAFDDVTVGDAAVNNFKRGDAIVGDGPANLRSMEVPLIVPLILLLKTMPLPLPLVIRFRRELDGKLRRGLMGVLTLRTKRRRLKLGVDSTRAGATDVR